MVKLQEKNGQYSITIPKEYVRDKGWKKGEELILGFDSNGNILIKGVRQKQGGSF